MKPKPNQIVILTFGAKANPYFRTPGLVNGGEEGWESAGSKGEDDGENAPSDEAEEDSDYWECNAGPK